MFKFPLNFFSNMKYSTCVVLVFYKKSNSPAFYFNLSKEGNILHVPCMCCIENIYIGAMLEAKQRRLDYHN